MSSSLAGPYHASFKSISVRLNPINYAILGYQSTSGMNFSTAWFFSSDFNASSLGIFLYL